MDAPMDAQMDPVQEVERKVERLLDTLHPEVSMAMLRRVQERTSTRTIRRIRVLINESLNVGDDIHDAISMHLYGYTFEMMYDDGDRRTGLPLRHHPMCLMMAACEGMRVSPITLGAGMTYVIGCIPGRDEFIRIVPGDLPEVPELTPYDVAYFIRACGTRISPAACDRLWALVKECLV